MDCVFIGATVFDQKFHAYDKTTGKLLWETQLPFSGLATPSTYMVNGKQYVVIAAGGGQSSRKPSGGVYVAFALPSRSIEKQQVLIQLSLPAELPRPILSFGPRFLSRCKAHTLTVAPRR